MVICVHTDGELFTWFPVNSGVCQGCITIPNLPGADGGQYTAVTQQSQSVSDLDFVDNVALLAEMLNILILPLQILQQGGTFGPGH